LTKRQIPIGDPRIKGMNDTQWVFELEAMNKEDLDRYKDIELMADIVKDQVVSMLGLNLCPVEDEETGLLRMPTPDEIMPLSVMTGRDDVLSMIKDRTEQLHTQQEVAGQLAASGQVGDDGRPVDTGVVEMTPDELEAFMEDDGDVECDSTPEELQRMMSWGGRDNQALLESLVLNKDDIEENSLSDVAARTIGQARHDMKREHSQQHIVEHVDLVSVQVTSDKSVEAEPSLDRPTVIVESD